MKLVEVEGSHTLQNSYSSLDVHLGQSYSVLVTTDQPVRDYYIVVSSRFTSPVLTTTAVLHYSGSSTVVQGVPPAGPTVQIDYSLNQARSIRWDRLLSLSLAGSRVGSVLLFSPADPSGSSLASLFLTHSLALRYASGFNLAFLSLDPCAVVRSILLFLVRILGGQSFSPCHSLSLSLSPYRRQSFLFLREPSGDNLSFLLESLVEAIFLFSLGER